MRLKQYINELAAKLEYFKIVRKTNRQFQTHFKTDRLEYYVDIDYYRFPDNSDPSWEISFYQYDSSAQNIDDKYLFHATGNVPTKKELVQVFTGVQKSIEEFFKLYKPKRFHFVAEDPAHKKLYDSLSKIVANKTKSKLTQEKRWNKEYYMFAYE